MWLEIKPKLIEFGISVALPFILRRLVQSGRISAAQELAIEYGIDLNRFLYSLKSDHELKDFPNPPPEVGAVHNFTVGAKRPE